MTREPILAIDIGGTKIAGGIVFPDGQIATAQTKPTHAQAGGEVVMRRVLELAQSVRDASPVAPNAIGVSAAGDVDPARGVITYATATIPGWTGTPIRAYLQNALRLPTFVDNDGNVMALGEAIHGAGRGRQQIIGLTVGTGIGGGIVLDGRVYHGARGFGGRLGHLIIDFSGRKKCSCGGTGCLEAYAASLAIIADFADQMNINPEKIGVKEIAELAVAGHNIAQSVIQRGAFFLGIGIASLLNLLNPEMIIIGGGVAQIGETYFAQVRRVAQERAQSSVGDTPIVPAELGTNANLIGAAELAWQGLNV